MEPALLLLFTLPLFFAYCYYRARRRHMEFLINQFPGPYSYPIIGNVLEEIKCKTGIHLIRTYVAVVGLQHRLGL